MAATPLARWFSERVRPVDVDSSQRGFPTGDDGVTRHLEECARAFVHGAHRYGRSPAAPHEVLQQVPERRRGFAYEGAGMVAALTDLASAGLGTHLRTLLAGPGHRYRHLVHVGAGWALSTARLTSPRVLVHLDPLLRWLAVDGMGFHRQYFHPSQTLYRLPAMRVGAHTQVFAAGVGRALWFTEAARVPAIGIAIATVPPGLRASLWAGVGLAACYAGTGTRPAGPSTAEELRVEAAGHLGAVRQGLLFGAAAVQAHGTGCTSAQVDLLAAFGIEPSTAAAVTDTAAAGLTTHDGPIENFQQWRVRLSSLPAPGVTRQQAPAEAAGV